MCCVSGAVGRIVQGGRLVEGSVGLNVPAVTAEPAVVHEAATAESLARLATDAG